MAAIEYDKLQEMFRQAKRDIENNVEPAGGIWPHLKPEEARELAELTDLPVFVVGKRKKQGVEISDGEG